MLVQILCENSLMAVRVAVVADVSGLPLELEGLVLFSSFEVGGGGSAED